MKKSYTEELFSSSMFLKVTDSRINRNELSSIDTTSQEEADQSSQKGLSKKLESLNSEKKDISETSKSSPSKKPLNISIKKMREEIFEMESKDTISIDQSEKTNQDFHFQKIQKSSKNFVFTISSESSWQKAEEKPVINKKNILVLGDITNESSVLNNALDGESFNLLGKMFDALKLTETEVRFCSFIEEGVNSYLSSKNFYDFIKETNTILVMTLGAAPLSFFKIKGRLTKVHGKKIDIFFDEKKVEVLPIFHPEYLLINPNMKKRVWDDIKYLMNS